jgi:hypothetical protein
VLLKIYSDCSEGVEGAAGSKLEIKIFPRAGAPVNGKKR